MRISSIIIFLLAAIGSWLYAPTLAMAQEPLPKRHQVEPGETLVWIAARYNIPPAALIERNHLANPNLLYAGQTLVLPSRADLHRQYVAHIIQPHETLSGIVAEYGLDVTVVQQFNVISDADRITSGAWLYLPLPVTPTTVLAVSPSPQLSPTLTVTPTAVPSTTRPAIITETTRPAPAVTNAMTIGKRIVVDLSEQRTYVYEGKRLIHKFVVSTGEPGRETATGTFQIQNKLPMAQAYTWGLQMPHWLGVYWAGSLQNGFHALPILPNGNRLWQGNLGQPVSYGCIILSQADAKTLYEWTEVGTPVIIQS